MSETTETIIIDILIGSHLMVLGLSKGQPLGEVSQRGCGHSFGSWTSGRYPRDWSSTFRKGGVSV